MLKEEVLLLSVLFFFRLVSILSGWFLPSVFPPILLMSSMLATVGLLCQTLGIGGFFLEAITGILGLFFDVLLVSWSALWFDLSSPLD